ncbi:hypothetical protein EON63_18340 [archaeon]|nr:MAG: hypothetical protein EON63_18340 [archaeon]
MYVCVEFLECRSPPSPSIKLRGAEGFYPLSYAQREYPYTCIYTYVYCHVIIERCKFTDTISCCACITYTYIPIPNLLTTHTHLSSLLYTRYGV